MKKKLKSRAKQCNSPPPPSPPLGGVVWPDGFPGSGSTDGARRTDSPRPPLDGHSLPIRTSAFFRSLIDFISDDNVVRDAEKQLMIFIDDIRVQFRFCVDNYV